jgi:predicted ATPase
LILRSVSYKRPRGPAAFPFDLPAVRTLATLEFTAPVTIFAGENGTGKSTLLEGLACAAGSVAVGARGVPTDPSLAHARALGRCLKLSWSARTGRGFFLRAEDFFGFVRETDRLRAEMEGHLTEVDRDYRGRSALARGLARTPYAGSLAGLDRSYGPGLDARSHGESLLALFKSRLVPGGLYLLDEPEAPLSPMRQLALVALLMEMTAQRCQFVIATHAPVIMAFPGAVILDFDSPPLRPAAFGDLEHIRFSRDFLNNPQAFLRKL